MSLLFVIAVDLLIRRIHSASQCKGVVVPTVHGPLRIPVAACADDITLYLSGPDDEVAFLNIVGLFGSALGLKINMTKCIGLHLHRNGETRKSITMQVRLICLTDSIRYLGIPVSSRDNSAYVLNHTFSAIQARMRLGVQKPTDVLQRAKLAAAIILPKLLFVFRDKRQRSAVVSKIDRAVHGFIWTGFLDLNNRRASKDQHGSQPAQSQDWGRWAPKRAEST